MPRITSDFTSVIGGSGYDNASAVVASSDGSIYVAGSTSKSFDGQILNGANNAFVTKFSASGNKIWTKFLGSAHTESTSIAVGSDGAIYLTGWTTSTTLNSDSGSDGFVSKISSDGSVIWSKNVYSSGADRLDGISGSSDGFLYLTGKVGTTSATSLNGKPLAANSTYLFVEKMSLDGLAQWTTLTRVSEFLCKRS
jgi:hypothetical protein